MGYIQNHRFENALSSALLYFLDGKGQLRAYDDKVYRSFDEARAAISDNEQLTEISYDDIVKKVFDLTGVIELLSVFSRLTEKSPSISLISQTSPSYLTRSPTSFKNI